MAQTLPFLLATLFFNLLAASHLQCIISKSTGFSLKLIPIDSQVSLYPQNLTTIERFRRLLESSDSRATYLQLMSKIRSENSTIFPDIMRPPVTRGSSLFMVDASLGTPIRKRAFIFDTSSDLIWTQCKPCYHCFKQRLPLFDPKISVSYKKLLPSHPLSPHFNCTNFECTYYVQYNSGQTSQGIGSIETFTFQSNTRVPETIKDIVFGCGNNNQGFNSRDTLVSGIMGMNKSPISLVRQLGLRIMQRFSYCLPAVNSPTKTTFLRFGKDIVTRGNRQITSFVRHPQYYNMYSVNLVDISIGRQRLGCQAKTFEGGCFIDTGSGTSRIELRAYNLILKALRLHFNRFNLIRLTGPGYPGDLCYRLRRGFNNFPSMTFHFQDANLEVAHTSLFHFEKTFFCLTLLGQQDITLLGAYQQQNIRFIYDLGYDKLAFVKEDCSKDRA